VCTVRRRILLHGAGLAQAELKFFVASIREDGMIQPSRRQNRSLYKPLFSQHSPNIFTRIANVYYLVTCGKFMVFTNKRIKNHNVHKTDGFTIPYLIVKTHGLRSTPYRASRVFRGLGSIMGCTSNSGYFVTPDSHSQIISTP
jgi:hypothetical protein